MGSARYRGFGYTAGMKIDAIALLTKTVDHLKANAKGHIEVAIAQFVFTLLLTFGWICLGGFAMIGGGIGGAVIDGALGGEGLGTLLGLLGYALFFVSFALVLPILIVLYFGYQSATLDEVDGKGPVSIRGVWGIITASIGALFALTAVSCGMSLVGVLFCYIGMFVTTLPFKFAHLIRHERGASLGEALGLSWRGFTAAPLDHLVVAIVEFIVIMVLAYIPLIGSMLVWPVVSVFDVLAYRVLHPKDEGLYGAG